MLNLESLGLLLTSKLTIASTACAEGKVSSESRTTMSALDPHLGSSEIAEGAAPVLHLAVMVPTASTSSHRQT